MSMIQVTNSNNNKIYINPLFIISLCELTNVDNRMCKTEISLFSLSMRFHSMICIEDIDTVFKKIEKAKDRR